MLAGVLEHLAEHQSRYIRIRDQKLSLLSDEASDRLIGREIAVEPPAGGASVIDELGKMELASARFREAVTVLFDSDVPLVATVHAFRHPFTDELKGRADVELVKLSRANRDELPAALADRILS